MTLTCPAGCECGQVSDHTPSIESRLWSMVAKSERCWEWLGKKSKKGYGVIQGRKYRSLRTHRVAWHLTYGCIPGGMYVLHACDNRCCVRPDHLFLGTPQDNTSDMMAKGRHGARRGTNVKLTPEIVRAIRRRRAEEGLTMRALGRLYGVGHDQIVRVVNSDQWRWVE